MNTMRADDVPQDNSATYDGHKKVIYAVDGKAQYEKVESSGWNVEEFATRMAISEIEELAAQAHERALRGISSPLEYYMYSKRFDVAELARAAGFFKWQVRRHFRPEVFAKLNLRQMARYAHAFGISAGELALLPDLPTRSR